MSAVSALAGPVPGSGRHGPRRGFGAAGKVGLAALAAVVAAHAHGHGPGGPGGLGGHAGHGRPGPGPFGFRGGRRAMMFGGFPFGGFKGPWPGRGPRVARGNVRAAILLLLEERPLHGYQLIHEIAERSGGFWRPSPGSIYPAVQQLDDEGLVRVENEGGRRVIHLTDAGREYIEEHREELGSPWDAVADTMDEDVVQLHDLLGQVAAAAMQVTHAGTEEQMAEARRVLVNTRRTLYRILAEGDADNDIPRGGEGQA